uniref:Uncharacterized protein n=1 Tax=Oryza brachyantha TaxID=4533 RepID=J3KVJ2_ORYBR
MNYDEKTPKSPPTVRLKIQILAYKHKQKRKDGAESSSVTYKALNIYYACRVTVSIDVEATCKWIIGFSRPVHTSWSHKIKGCWGWKRWSTRQFLALEVECRVALGSRGRVTGELEHRVSPGGIVTEGGALGNGWQ